MTTYSAISPAVPAISVDPINVTQNPPRYDDLPDDFKYGVSIDQCDVMIRMAFVRKVYSILGLQLLVTIGVSALYLSLDGMAKWTQTHPEFLLLSGLLSIVSLVALIIHRRSSPLNLYLLSAFTLCEAHMIGTVVTLYDSVVVLKALVITFGLFVGLSLYTVQSKADFSGLGPYLFGGLLSVLLGSVVQIFFPFSSLLQFGIAVFSAILFCGYIIFDTQMIFQKLSPEEYIVASVELYMDILNLFLAILRILNSRRD